MVLDGALDDLDPPPVASASEDGDGDGVVDEIDPALVDYLEFYLLNYFKPGRYEPYPTASQRGRSLFEEIGCASCHMPNHRDRARSPRRRRRDRIRPGAGRLQWPVRHGAPAATHGTRTTPRCRRCSRRPSGASVVRDIFTDFKRHDLGPNFWERNFDGTLQREFMTEPLWGVATTAPYGHDGRSINLREVILRHGGEAQEARDAFAALPDASQRQLLEFLASLVLFPPEDTASNLDPGDPTAPDFPQFGHGSIALGELFNDPSDRE